MILAAPRAWAATAEEVLALMREVCLTHGASLTRVEIVARQRGWRELSMAELEAAREPNEIGYMTGWSVREGADAITLSISLPPWTLTNAMRRRLDSGSTVLPPPEGSLRMFGDQAPVFPSRSTMQFCEIRFAAGATQGEAIVVGASALPFLDETFGDPAEDYGAPVNGLAQPDGARLWRWSRHRDPTWQQIKLVLQVGTDRPSTFRVAQNWNE